MAKVRQNKESWQLGYHDGLQGDEKKQQALALDRLAYTSGFIEGRSTRLVFPECTPDESVRGIEKALARRRQQELRREE